MADFELRRPSSENQFREQLLKLFANKKHIDAITVDVTQDEIRVDLSRMANTFGNGDFRLKLRSGKAVEARLIVDRLKHQVEPTPQDSRDLYDLLVHDH